MSTNDRPIAKRLLHLLDLTSLGEDDTPMRIAALCAAARTPQGEVAAVCVYPEHVQACLTALRESTVRVATVVNFPEGGSDAGRAVREVRRAVAVGAQEIDVVFPWRALLAGDAEAGAGLVAACRTALPKGVVLKVILETGMLEGAQIRRAADIALAGGADFLKTSTGKVAMGATPQAARVMLEAIAASGRPCGLKVSGGVRTLADAAGYLALAESVMGAGWATRARFRIGASALLDELLHALGAGAAVNAGAGY